jgi:uncharacterized protein YcbX
MSRPESSRLTRIRIYPIKSLDGIDLNRVGLQGLGGLNGDREYRIIDELGRVMNTKRAGEVMTRIRARFGSNGRVADLERDDGEGRFWLPDDLSELGFWLGAQFGETVRVERNTTTGFPDDTDASGPTIVSRATLLEVASWFLWDEEETRRRFRANLEVDGVPAFWEDGLFGEKGEERIVKIGGAALEAVNPCARCTVPSRNPDTGRIEDAAFAKTFAERRREGLPGWARASRFGHFYRLAVNTRIPVAQAGRTIAVGDLVELAQ